MLSVLVSYPTEPTVQNPLVYMSYCMSNPKMSHSLNAIFDHVDILKDIPLFLNTLPPLLLLCLNSFAYYSS